MKKSQVILCFLGALLTLIVFPNAMAGQCQMGWGIDNRDNPGSVNVFLTTKDSNNQQIGMLEVKVGAGQKANSFIDASDQGGSITATSPDLWEKPVHNSEQYSGNICSTGQYALVEPVFNIYSKLSNLYVRFVPH